MSSQAPAVSSSRTAAMNASAVPSGVLVSSEPPQPDNISAALNATTPALLAARRIEPSDQTFIDPPLVVDDLSCPMRAWYPTPCTRSHAADRLRRSLAHHRAG